jgi:hypothetical protein
MKEFLWELILSFAHQVVKIFKLSSNDYPMNSMLKRYLVVVLVVCSGCYHYRITPPKFDPATEYKKETVHIFFWGLVQCSPITADNCLANALDEVVVDNNLGFSFITVATLGMWAPMQIRWKCSKPCQRTEEL